MYANLKLHLWRSGLRQNHLAKILGIHESELSKIINGFREPSPALRAQIAELLREDEGMLFQKLPIEQEADSSEPPRESLSQQDDTTADDKSR
jgi:transcriptional regulator with XRE-family HTH domain